MAQSSELIAAVIAPEQNIVFSSSRRLIRKTATKKWGIHFRHWTSWSFYSLFCKK